MKTKPNHLLVLVFALLPFAPQAQVDVKVDEVPLTVGMKNGKLQPCPDKPNCVSTYDHNPRENQTLDTIQIISTPEIARSKLEAIVTKLGGEIQSREINYWHVTFTSSFFKFVDDVEFVWEDKQIHFKSASRKGHWDIGVNKKRMEDIRFKFMQNDY